MERKEKENSKRITTTTEKGTCTEQYLLVLKICSAIDGIDFPIYKATESWKCLKQYSRVHIYFGLCYHFLYFTSWVCSKWVIGKIL